MCKPILGQDTPTDKKENKTVTVTFDLNYKEATGTPPDPQTVTKDGKATKPADPTRDGYLFDGWYDAKTAGNQFVFGTTTITADITLYARWTAYSVTVTLGNEAYTLTPDDKIDKILSIVVDKTYAELHAIPTVMLTTVHLPGTTNPAEGKPLNLIDGRGTITATQDGVDTPYTVKLMIKPATRDQLIAIVNAAIDTTNGGSDTANLNFIDTSEITDMRDLFRVKTTFNGDLSEWDTSKVTNMSFMFYYAIDFNQDIGDWNTASVTNMERMFLQTSDFNQDIGGWNTSNVTNMESMFKEAKSFNQDIGNWNTAKVTNMSDMFTSTIAFNQDIGSWNTASVKNMSFMFKGARIFNQNLSTWNVASVTNHADIFKDSAMATKTTQHPNWP